MNFKSHGIVKKGKLRETVRRKAAGLTFPIKYVSRAATISAFFANVFNNLLEDKGMQKIKKKLSFFVLIVLLLQLFSPITQAFAASTLPAPANLRSSLDGIDNVILRWDAVSGATVYRVYEINGEGKVQLSQTSNLNRYFPTVSAGTHTYAVTAVNSAGSPHYHHR